MSDEMSECPTTGAVDSGLPPGRRKSGGAVAGTLPTLQRNALRKLFDRREFTPAEVAALGYRRLQQASGIGNKGLAAIAAWLRHHGFELRQPEPPPQPPMPGGLKKSQRSLDLAVRLLRIHGYVVHETPRDSGEPG